MTKVELIDAYRDLRRIANDTDKLRAAVTMSKSIVATTRRAAERRWGEGGTVQLSRLDDRLSSIGNISQLKTSQMSDAQMRALLEAYRGFFLTRDMSVPNGGLIEPKTSTVKGYEDYLKQYETKMSMPGYSTWTENQRKDFWDLIDDIRAEGHSDFFTPGYESGRWIQSIWQLQTSDQGLKDLETGENLEWTHENVIKVMQQMREAENRKREAPMPDFM